jgi:BirA family transcriptional regulator, biotin operon repressor / biotin---[acetyl-CoA-carboxylase] ligase
MEDDKVASKQEVLALLEKQKGMNVSGEAIAGSLSISRAAVWRAIKDLQAEGHAIEASTRVGYRLLDSSDILSSEGIRPYLQSGFSGDLICHPSLDSTNREIRRLALEGAPHGTVVLAGRQTEGRGRNGRSFFSPGDTGIYMSMLLRPDLGTSSALLCTTAAAVAVCRAVDSFRSGSAGIKWVNDIHLDGKKVCGILTEGVMGFESGRIESIVIGIGVNFSTPQEVFPPELRGVAGSVFDGSVPAGVSRNRMAAAIINHLLTLTGELESPTFMEEYRRRSVVIGKEVQVLQGNQVYQAVAEEIDDVGVLWVRTLGGDRKSLNSGEISLRPLDGACW